MHPDSKDDERRITYFAATHTRGKREMFGIRAIDRGKHMYVIGKTGMGKSTLLENLAIQDIQNGEGLAFIDPHGSTAEKLLDFVPHDRIKDVVYFAPFDTDHPLGFNVMEDVGYDKRHLVVSGLMGALKRIWVDAWSARMEYILQNTLLALLEYPGSTLLDVNRMLTNKTFREVVVNNVRDPIVRAFWTEEFAGFTDTYTREATPAIQNKIGQFVANPLIRNIVGQPRSTFDLREIMDKKKIFIVNLSKGRMGETNASLLGSMLTVKIYLAAMSRADETETRMRNLPRFYFYVDEFQSMMNEAFADILSESRKYKLALTLANQYIEQMEEHVRDAVFGNVGTTICFRVGPFDAEVLKTVFEPTFHAEDLINLGIGDIYLTLMIDGVGSPPFSAKTIPPIERPTITYREDVITSSRALYSTPRAEIESRIHSKQEEFPMPAAKPKERSGFRPAQQGNAPRRFDDSKPPAEVLRAQPASHEPAREPSAVRESAPALSQRDEGGERHAPLRPRSEDRLPSRTPVPQKPPRKEDPRNALRHAITQARTQSTASSPENGHSSPLHMMRQKKEGAQHKNHTHAAARDAAPTPERPSQARAEVPPPVSSRESREEPQKKEREEISPELLRRILHASNRDADE